MPQYRVRVTREITYETFVTVIADNQDIALDEGIATAQNSINTLTWETSKDKEVFSGSATAVWFDYIIYGIAPEKPEGHEFRSRVPDLDRRPDLWDAECPFAIPMRALLAHGISVERPNVRT